MQVIDCNRKKDQQWECGFLNSQIEPAFISSNATEKSVTDGIASFPFPHDKLVERR
jgi:hypothetical protein